MPGEQTATASPKTSHSNSAYKESASRRRQILLHHVLTMELSNVQSRSKKQNRDLKIGFNGVLNILDCDVNNEQT